MLAWIKTQHTFKNSVRESTSKRSHPLCKTNHNDTASERFRFRWLQKWSHFCVITTCYIYHMSSVARPIRLALWRTLVFVLSVCYLLKTIPLPCAVSHGEWEGVYVLILTFSLASLRSQCRCKEPWFLFFVRRAERAFSFSAIFFSLFFFFASFFSWCRQSRWNKSIFLQVFFFC